MTETTSGKSGNYRQRLLRNRWIKPLVGYTKRMYDSAIETNSQVKIQLLQFIPFFIAAAITGILAFGYAELFRLAEKFSHSLHAVHPFFIFVLTPACFLLSWWVVVRYAPNAKGSGIPQVMAALQLSNPSTGKYINTLLSVRIAVVKIISSVFKVIGGGIVGREGPTIQIASSVFHEVQNRLPKWWISISQKNMLMAGAASGLAAAFNTPLGGIIFAIEELSKFHVRYYKSSLFIAVIIAGLAAQGLGGSYLYLGYPKLSIDSWKVIAGVLLTAMLCGYFGSKMGVWILGIMKRITRFKNRLKQVGIVLVSGILMAIIIYFLGSESMGSGKEIMDRTLFTADKQVEWYMPFARIAGLITSFSFGGAGGVFAPSLSAGASMGAVVAGFLNLASGNANILILVGMTTFLTGITRAPFTASIIIFEMTDRHSVIFYLLLGALVANLIARYVDKQSFYDQLREQYVNDVIHRTKDAQ
ncbi:MAG: chloride channel protein [Ferruginibacter sp.]|nr:chloride channel protein [Ferruginibacter sp.]